MKIFKLFNKTIDHKLFFSSFLVVMLAELANTITCLIDGILTGRFLGSEAMSAYGLASPYFSIAAIGSGILTVSCQTLCTKALSKGDRERANQIFSTTIIIAFCVSSLLALSIILFPNSFCSLLGVRGESLVLLEETKRYLIPLGASCPLMVLIAVCIPILQLDGAGRKATISSLVIAVVDIAFDLLNIFVLKWGILGMGLASSLSYVGAIIVIINHFRSKDCYFKFSFKYFNKKDCAPIIIDGLPRGIMRLCEGLGPIILNIMIVSVIGVVGIEAIAIQRNVAFLVGTVGWGISGAIMQTTAIYYAERDVSGIKRMLNIAYGYNFIFGIGRTILVVILAPEIVSLYISQPGEINGIATTAVIVYALRVFFINFNFITSNYAQVIGRTGLALFGNTASGFGYLIPLTYILGDQFGGDGFWVSFPTSEILVSITLVIVMLALNKGKIKDCNLMLKDGFAIDNDKRLSFTFTNSTTSLEVSKMVQDFSSEAGVDDKKSFKLALAVEEMIMSTIEHGFDDGKKHMIDVRISYDEEDIILRIRDDCALLDLKEKAKDWEENINDPMDNIGIRLVMGISKNVSYTNIMGTNNLLIVI